MSLYHWVLRYHHVFMSPATKKVIPRHEKRRAWHAKWSWHSGSKIDDNLAKRAFWALKKNAQDHETHRNAVPAMEKSPFSGTMILWPASLLQAFLHLNTNGSTFCTWRVPCAIAFLEEAMWAHSFPLRPRLHCPKQTRRAGENEESSRGRSYETSFENARWRMMEEGFWRKDQRNSRTLTERTSSVHTHCLGNQEEEEVQQEL